MIPWDGQTIHEAIQRYLKAPKREAVKAEDRCVNEEAPGCAGRAEANGWVQALLGGHRADAMTDDSDPRRDKTREFFQTLGPADPEDAGA